MPSSNLAKSHRRHPTALATATDAKMRDYEVVVPRDAVASLTDERNERAVMHFESVLGVRTTRAARVRPGGRG